MCNKMKKKKLYHMVQTIQGNAKIDNKWILNDDFIDHIVEYMYWLIVKIWSNHFGAKINNRS